MLLVRRATNNNDCYLRTDSLQFLVYGCARRLQHELGFRSNLVGRAFVSLSSVSRRSTEWFNRAPCPVSQVASNSLVRPLWRETVGCSTGASGTLVRRYSVIVLDCQPQPKSYSTKGPLHMLTSMLICINRHIYIPGLHWAPQWPAINRYTEISFHNTPHSTYPANFLCRWVAFNEAGRERA